MWCLALHFIHPLLLHLFSPCPCLPQLKQSLPSTKNLFLLSIVSKVSPVSPQCSPLHNKQGGPCFLTYVGCVSLPLVNHCFSFLNLELSGTLLYVSLSLFLFIHLSKFVINSPMSHFSQFSSVLTKSGLT